MSNLGRIVSLITLGLALVVIAIMLFLSLKLPEKAKKIEMEVPTMSQTAHAAIDFAKTRWPLIALVVVAIVLVAKEFMGNKWFSAGVNLLLLVLLIVAWVMVGRALGHAGPPPPQP
jgi:type II secretory pathway component PulF